MKVILLQDITKVGRRYEIKEVADGFGRNYILARGWGMPADKKNLAKLEKLKSEQQVTSQIHRELLEKTLADLAAKTLTISAKANPEGHLFASIHAEQIAAALKREHHLDLDPKLIVLDQPIKTVGEHQVEIKSGDLTGSLKVEVVGEN